jgi:sugar lactone lactonase YvrE
MISALVLACVASVAGVEVSAGPVEKVNGGYKFTEGPVWTPKGLLFVDLGSSAIHHGDGKVFRKPSGAANGLALDKQGRLIACEHENRRVSVTEADGSIKALADRYDGKRFNSPNDLAIRSDGAIFFTDPPYGLGDKPSELGFQGVYLLTTAGEVKLLHQDMYRPNGIALSKDEKRLFVADSEKDFIMVFDVAADGSLSNAARFTECPGPDGIETGPQGELWVTAGDGVRVYDTEPGANARLILTIPTPEQPANLTLGGADGKTLYITARTGLYKAAVSWGK